MQDYLYFLRAHAGDALAYQRWWQHELAPTLAASPDCARLQVNLAVAPPDGRALYQNEVLEGDHFDLTVDLTCPDASAHRRLVTDWMPEILRRSDACFGYAVRRSIELDDPVKLQGSPAPGYKIMRGFHVHADLPDSAFQRSWDLHARFAKKAHGFTRYVRYFVDHAVTDHAPPIRGATSLHFASAEDVSQRYFLIPNGSDLIAHDIAHFIERGLARVYTREYTVK